MYSTLHSLLVTYTRRHGALAEILPMDKVKWPEDVEHLEEVASQLSKSDTDLLMTTNDIVYSLEWDDRLGLFTFLQMVTDLDNDPLHVPDMVHAHYYEQ